MSEQNNKPDENCTHDCSTCGASCSSRKITFSKLNKNSVVRKTIAVMSGKGGVGKTMVSSMRATSLRRQGLSVGIMDADITGPSVPQCFGLEDPCYASPENFILPATTTTGIKAVSINLLLTDKTAPVVWRGAIVSDMIRQFWTEVDWGNVDTMVIDCPPGTGDVPLTVLQSIPVDGIVIVTSPQDLVQIIVGKAVKMAQMMNIPILGIVENMSYVECPDCGKKIEVFGKSKVEETAKKFDIPVLAKLPIKQELASQADLGIVEMHDCDKELKELVDAVMSQPVLERDDR